MWIMPVRKQSQFATPEVSPELGDLGRFQPFQPGVDLHIQLRAMRGQISPLRSAVRTSGRDDKGKSRTSGRDDKSKGRTSGRDDKKWKSLKIRRQMSSRSTEGCL
jgi:hypothetical protein